jgi:hypothetical protein
MADDRPELETERLPRPPRHRLVDAGHVAGIQRPTDPAPCQHGAEQRPGFDARGVDPGLQMAHRVRGCRRVQTSFAARQLCPERPGRFPARTTSRPQTVPTRVPRTSVLAP